MFWSRFGDEKNFGFSDEKCSFSVLTYLREREIELKIPGVASIHNVTFGSNAITIQQADDIGGKLISASEFKDAFPVRHLSKLGKLDLKPPQDVMQQLEPVTDLSKVARAKRSKTNRQQAQQDKATVMGKKFDAKYNGFLMKNNMFRAKLFSHHE